MYRGKIEIRLQGNEKRARTQTNSQQKNPAPARLSSAIPHVGQPMENTHGAGQSLGQGWEWELRARGEVRALCKVSRGS